MCSLEAYQGWLEACQGWPGGGTGGNVLTSAVQGEGCFESLLTLAEPSQKALPTRCHALCGASWLHVLLVGCWFASFMCTCIMQRCSRRSMSAEGSTDTTQLNLLMVRDMSWQTYIERSSAPCDDVCKGAHLCLFLCLCPRFTHAHAHRWLLHL